MPGPWPHGRQEPEGRRQQGQGVPTAAAGAGPHGHRGSAAQGHAATLLPKPVHWVAAEGAGRASSNALNTPMCSLSKWLALEAPSCLGPKG